MYTDTQRAAGSALERCSLRAAGGEDLAHHVNADADLGYDFDESGCRTYVFPRVRHCVRTRRATGIPVQQA